MGWGVWPVPGPPAEWPGSPCPVMGAAAWSSPLFLPEPLRVSWPHSQEGEGCLCGCPPPVSWLMLGLPPCLPWGSLPLGSLPASSTPDVPLTLLAPHESDSAVPPGVRFPVSVPAKEEVGDSWLSVLPHPPCPRSSSKVNSSPQTSLGSSRHKGHREESSDRNLGGQRETESSRNPEGNLQARKIKKRKVEMKMHRTTSHIHRKARDTQGVRN